MKFSCIWLTILLAAMPIDEGVKKELPDQKIR